MHSLELQHDHLLNGLPVRPNILNLWNTCSEILGFNVFHTLCKEGKDYQKKMNTTHHTYEHAISSPDSVELMK